MRINHDKLNKGPLVPVDAAIQSSTPHSLTSEEVNNMIYKAECILFPGTRIYICCITMKNGFHVVGYSSDVNQENYESPRDMAIYKAREKIWDLLSYQIMSRTE